MALPIQAAPSYTLTLPISKKVVKYRPFLVKEQRSLLVARESENTKDIMQAVIDMISAVTSKTVDANKLAVGDLEYLFMQIRAKSVGETAGISVACTRTDCEGDGWGRVEVDLNDVEVEVDEDVDNMIKLNDDLVVEMQYPTVTSVTKVDGMNEADAIKPVLRGCMVRLFDDENVYEFSEYRDSEIDDFIDSLTIDQFEKMTEFFQNVPTLKHEVTFTCSKCKKENTRVLEGLNSFF